MPLAEKQHQLVARFAIIEDHHERLAAIVARGVHWPDVTAAERDDAHIIRGCTTPVWLASSFTDGRCHFRIAAGSALVKGLAALLAELYDGETPAAILAWEPTLLEALHLDRHISPTRLHGLAHIRRAIREFAAAAP
ncbi:MAG: SufE family protein [Chthoniobacter sp.]|nr:SufE family protein [Chthoniobacter sp.]